MDIRVSRTQKMLLDAFEELASEKNMEDISVSELCERSTVRRNTFYRHFNDKYAFITFYLQTLAERFKVEAGSGYDLEELSDYASHMHKALIRFFESHQESMKYAMGRTVPVSTVDMIVTHISEGIISRAERGLNRDGHTPGKPVELLGYFYSAGMLHTLRWWYFEGKPVAPELLEQYCTDFLMRCYAGFEEQA
ncbi:MAG: TetR/AcrR family transcriptional regulator [Coriobacteriia bacterium]|nr:TetR/AcrR family transcriptional regulator [Coriobacteriia bacterium]